MNKAVALLNEPAEGLNVVDLKKALLRSLLVMAWAVEARDPYTGGHLWRVSQLAGLLAGAAGLEEQDVARVVIGGFLHDLGKIAVPDSILTKAERLTEQEFSVIRTHPDAGWQLIKEHPLADLVEASIRAHHETPDGKGYPRGLTVDDIPVVAKIVGICDAFDAMTSTRPYRTALPIATALERLQANKGIQFDPDLVDAFLAIGEEKLSHIVGHSDTNRPLLDCYVCGPVVEMPPDGVDTVYCRVCTGKFNIQRDADGKASLEFADDHGSGEDLLPNPDMKHLHTNFSEFGLFME